MGLSKWASRFLTKRTDVPELVELPITPLQDFILEDFGHRSRTAPTIRPDEDEDHSSSGEEVLPAIGAPITITYLDSDDENEDAKTPQKNQSNSAKTPSKRTPVSQRYFLKNVSTKCYNCGAIGHMSNECIDAPEVKNCYFCAKPGHHEGACPSQRCFACLQPGHKIQDCQNSRVRRGDYCGICGQTDHYQEDCHVLSTDFKGIRCMVCFEVGHSTCVAPKVVSWKKHCPKCAENHSLSECTFNYDRFVQPRNNYRQNVNHFNQHQKKRQSYSPPPPPLTSARKHNNKRHRSSYSSSSNTYSHERKSHQNNKRRRY